MDKKYSFIIMFDEMSNEKMESFTEFIINNNIKIQVLKSDYELRKLENLKQQLKKKDEVIEKAISFIGSIDLSERPYVLYTDEIEELLQILEDKEAQ